MVARFASFWSLLPGTTRGIALMVLSTVGFAVMHALVRHLAQDLSAIQIAFFRNLFGLLVFLPWFLRYGFAPLRTQRFPLHLLRAVLNVTAMFAFFTALGITPIAQVTALAFTAPIFATLLGFFLLREVFRLRRWTAVVIGFLGTLVVLRPGFAEVDLGSLLALGSSLVWGFVLIVIKQLGRTESSITITSYMNILLSLLSFVPALFVWQTPTLPQVGILVAIGVTGTVSQIAVAQSLKETETSVVMPFDFLKLIWVSILGFAFFEEVPTLFVWLGGAMIFASSSYIAYRENRQARSDKAERLARPPEH